jgi:DNA-binding response OmpR family regulator
MVEDEIAFQEIYTKALKKHGFKIDHAENGKDALEKIKNNSYDALLIDIIIPFFSGLTVLTKFRKKTEKIIILTTLDGITDKEDSKKVGADLFISKKDCSPQMLVKQLKKILGA